MAHAWQVDDPIEVPSLFAPSSGEQLNGQYQVHALAKIILYKGKDIGAILSMLWANSLGLFKQSHSH